ncbi:MAG: hypothetical protein ACLRMJ_11180 [Alistipes finegoldii]
MVLSGEISTVCSAVTYRRGNERKTALRQVLQEIGPVASVAMPMVVPFTAMVAKARCS